VSSSPPPTEPAPPPQITTLPPPLADLRHQLFPPEGAGRPSRDFAQVSRLDRVRGLRHLVETVLELLASGMTTDEILHDHPDLERDDILAASSSQPSPRVCSTRSTSAA